MNLIVGWKLFTCRTNSSISFLLVSHTDMTSSINLFYFGHEDVSKGYGHFRAHGCSMGLIIIFLVRESHLAVVLSIVSTVGLSRGR